MVKEQTLDFGQIRLSRIKDDSVDDLYFLSGKYMYEIGAQSGNYPLLGWRRPGFLVGKSITIHGLAGREDQAAHLLNEMGGLWAHPIKVLDSFYFSIVDGDDVWPLNDCRRFVYHLAYADFHFEHDGIVVKRTDFIAEDAPALFSTLHIINHKDRAAKLNLVLSATVNLMPAWFAGLQNGEDLVFYDDGKAIAYDTVNPQKWAVVFGAKQRPDSEKVDVLDGKKRVEFTYGLNLNAGEEATIPFLFVAESERGYPEAIRRFNLLIDQGPRLLEEKIAYYQEKVFGGVRFESSDSWHTMAFYTAKANLAMLMADNPKIGRYLYAGIPEYVQFFGTDTAYSVPGLLVADYWDIAKDALRGLARFGDMLCGRIPHEITTGGRIFHPGNTQETPQFTIAAWNYFKWTGDRAFLEEVYPICRMGVVDYVPAHWDTDLDYYPDGNGIVERPGMGAEKLDSICYFTRALYCLAEMARILGYDEEAGIYLRRASDLEEAINADWWLEEQSVYADSLNEDHSPQLDGHWTVAVPLEARLAPWERAKRSLERIRRDWVSENGLVHTKDKEFDVWTLPTGVLALAAFYYNEPDFAVSLLRNITRTIETGTLGTYKELIPEGLSFVQLWSPAIYLQGLIQGVFGLSPSAESDFIEIAPQVPTQWSLAKVEQLHVGNHWIAIAIERAGSERTAVDYTAGHGRLTCRLRLVTERTTRVETRYGEADALKWRFERGDGGECIVIDADLELGQRVEAVYDRDRGVMEIALSKEQVRAES